MTELELAKFANYVPAVQDSRSRAAQHLLIAVMIIFILALHGWNIAADVPDTFSPKELGLRVDEGYKTLGPRNLSLFGSLRWSAHDEYGYWFRGSPLTQVVMLASFKVFGADLRVARLTALGYFAGLLLLVVWLGRSRLPVRYAMLTVLLLGLEPVLFFFSRAALFEILMSAFLTATLLGLDHPRISTGQRPLIALFCAMVLAFFLVKSSALIYFLPALGAVALSNVFPRQAHPGIVKRVGIVVLLVAFLAILSLPAWINRVSLPGAGTLFKRLAGNALATNSPFFTAAAWIAAADLIRQRGLSLFHDKFLTALLASVIGPPILLTLMTYAPPRYFVAILPTQVLLTVIWLRLASNDKAQSSTEPWILWGVSWPVAALGFFYLGWAVIDALLPLLGLFQGAEPGISAPTAIRFLFIPCALAAGAWLWVERRGVGLRRLKSAAAVCLLVAAAGHAISTVYPVLSRPVYAVQQISSTLKTVLPANASLVGDWAPLFALGTDFPAIYASSDRNQGEMVLRLCPSHYLDSGTRFDQSVVDSYKAVGVRFASPRLLGTYYGHAISLYALDYAAAEGACRLPPIPAPAGRLIPPDALPAQ
jgi:4-amino-4-deoxy-L-arabinose transferase-like glycosyltransferase